MAELELDNEQMRPEIRKWMGKLFDDNVHVDNVKAHVVKLTEKVVAAQLKGIKVTQSVFNELCKEVENDFNRQ